MIFGKRKGAVKMPSDPRGAPLKRWCMEVMTTLQQLRDSGVDVAFPKPSSPKNQFKVTGGGDAVESNYTFRVRGGYFLIRTMTSGEDNLVRVIPKIDIDSTMTPLPPEETAEIVLTAGQAIFLKVETDDMDTLSADDPVDPEADPPAPPLYKVSIVAASETVESTQAQPGDDTDSDGTDGVYYYPLALIEIDDDDRATVKQVQQGGPIIHTPALWKGENIGGGAGVFKDRDTANNTQRFRSVRGNHGIAETEDASEVVLDFYAENIGGENEVYVVPDPLADGQAQFRTIRELYTDEDENFSSAQIKVSTEDGDGEGTDDTILVRGNGVVEDVTNATSISMSVKDGLVTSLTGSTTTGGNLDLEVYVLSFTEVPADGETVMQLVNNELHATHYWRDGIYLGTTDPEDSPGDLITEKVTYMEEYGV